MTGDGARGATGGAAGPARPAGGAAGGGGAEPADGGPAETGTGGPLQGLREVPRPVRLLAAGTFVGAVVGFTFVFVFVYLTGPRGLGAAAAGLLTGVGGVGLVAGNFTGGWFGDRHGHRRVLLIASAAGGTLMLTLPLLPTPLLWLALPLVQYAAGVSAPRTPP